MTLLFMIPTFNDNDRGVSITVRFDENTHPRQLTWIKAENAEVWSNILSVRTGIGSIIDDASIEICVKVKYKGSTNEKLMKGTTYLWLHKSAAKTCSIKALQAAADANYKKYGAGRKLPDKFSNLDFVFETWSAQEIKDMLGNSLDAEELAVIDRYNPTVSVEFGFSAKLWNQFNETMGLRAGYKVLAAGIQLAANNMPQGEVITIPLNRNIGRQNQLHFLFHFDNYSPDLGRKGFNRELTDFAKSVARTITENHLSKLKQNLKANTGIAPDFVREVKISDWKKEMLQHEEKYPLELKSEHFFHPTERVSITSTPTREQDVIALFHQLVAGGVIRGISVMSTNERFTYDGLFRICFDLSKELYTYDPEKNPLGVPQETADALGGRITDPRVLEYKFCLDGLIEDFDTQDKNIKDIDLCIVWNTGNMYKERYGISSLLLPENADQRQYHGITHVLEDMESGAKHCDLIVLSELVEYLNSPEIAAEEQRNKYD